MATRLDSLVIDTPDPHGLAAWWSRALGWAPPREDYPDFPEDVLVRPRDGDPGIELVFGRVVEPKRDKNRLHLDLATHSLQDQQDTVDRLERLGARRADVGQGDVPWTVLADPEGNELCVLDPRDRYLAAGVVAAVVVDALEPAALARFWAAATGWRLTDSGPHGAALHPGPSARTDAGGPEATGAQTVGPDGAGPDRPAGGPYLEFVPTDRPHRGKNRWHLDVRPEPGADQEAEVERLIRLGAHRTEIGQSAAPPGRISWVVLADPEGNEFCVLRPARA